MQIKTRYDIGVYPVFHGSSSRLGLSKSEIAKTSTFTATLTATDPEGFTYFTAKSYTAIADTDDDHDESTTGIIDYQRTLGEKRYELTNHLENVAEVVSDRKIQVPNGGSTATDYFIADVKSYSDFYAFHSLKPGRNFTASDDYRYSVNGQEKETEITGTASHSSAEYWMYDSRIGRRWEMDPVVKTWESPYVTFANNPIIYTDVKGDDVGYADKKTQRKVRRAARRSEKVKRELEAREADHDNLYVYQHKKNEPSLLDGGRTEETRYSEGGNAGPTRVLFDKTNIMSNDDGSFSWTPLGLNFKIKVYKHEYEWTKVKEYETNLQMSNAGRAKFTRTVRRTSYDPNSFFLQFNSYSLPDKIQIFNQNGELLFEYHGTTLGPGASPPTQPDQRGFINVTPNMFNPTRNTTTKIKIVVSTQPFYRKWDSGQSCWCGTLKFNDSVWALRGNSGGSSTETKTRRFSIWLPWRQKNTSE